MTEEVNTTAEQFYYLLYTQLLANCPKDTRNMVTHITLEDNGDHWKITISGPGKSSGGFYDYARAVNEKTTPNISGPNKGKINFQWVEKTIKQVSEVIGGNVRYELY